MHFDFFFLYPLHRKWKIFVKDFFVKISNFQSKNNLACFIFFLFPAVHLEFLTSTKETALILVLVRIPWVVALLPAVGARLGSHVLVKQHFPPAAS